MRICIVQCTDGDDAPDFGLQLHVLLDGSRAFLLLQRREEVRPDPRTNFERRAIHNQR